MTPRQQTLSIVVVVVLLAGCSGFGSSGPASDGGVSTQTATPTSETPETVVFEPTETTETVVAAPPQTRTPTTTVETTTEAETKTETTTRSSGGSWSPPRDSESGEVSSNLNVSVRVGS